MREGTLIQVGAEWQLRFERRLPQPPERVWSALTEPDELRAWFPSTIDGERREGAALTFRIEDQPGIAPFEGRVLRFDPPRLFELTWGGDTLRWELALEGDGTVLTLHVTLDERGKAARDGAGWHECLDALEAHAAGDETWERSRNWRERNARYAELFGPEAATIGPPEGWEEPR